MINWIQQNLASILVCLALGGVVALSIVLTVRSRRKGKSPCGCSCKSCGMCNCCHTPSERT